MNTFFSAKAGNTSFSAYTSFEYFLVVYEIRFRPLCANLLFKVECPVCRV